MFFHLLYIHLFRPFLKYTPSSSPLPSHVSPRKVCSQAAASISKLMRLYKRTYGLVQICNIAVYIAHSACTIHLLNLPEKTAKRDFIHGIKNLEEIAENWLCARRTLSILSVLARKWKIDLPEEAVTVFARTDAKFGTFSTADVPSPKQELVVTTPPDGASPARIPPRQPLSPSQARVKTQTPLHQSLYSYRPEFQQVNGSAGLHSLSQSAPGYQSINSPIMMHAQTHDYYNSSNNNNNNPTNNNNNNNNNSSNNSVSGSMITPLGAGVASMPYPRQNLPGSSTDNSRNTSTGSLHHSRNNSSVNSEASASLTKQQGKPQNMQAGHGGIDALAESQSGWLQDQVSLLLGFDNWDTQAGSRNLTKQSPSMKRISTARDSDSMAVMGNGYEMQPHGFNGNGNGNGNGHSNGNGNRNGHGNNDSYHEDDWTSYSGMCG
jgi:hypothetical protein